MGVNPDRFQQVLEAAEPKLRSISEPDSMRRRAPDAWCAKEVLGHLIDSASNNHQRFIRGQLAATFQSLPYEQNAWVERGGYVSRPWNELVELWLAMNRQMLHIARRIKPESLDASIIVGNNPPVTLEFIVNDYVRHLEHHLRQLDEAVR